MIPGDTKRITFLWCKHCCRAVSSERFAWHQTLRHRLWQRLRGVLR